MQQRAKRHLALLVPQRFYVTQQARYGDRHLYGSLTRFIPPQVQALFDAVRPEAAEPEDMRQPPRQGLIDVAAIVRGLF